MASETQPDETEYKAVKAAGEKAIRKHLAHRPVACAKIEQFIQTIGAYESAMSHVKRQTEQLRQLPAGRDKTDLTEKLLEFFTDASEDVRATARPIAELCEAQGVDATPVARLIAEPGLLSAEPSHGRAVIETVMALIERLAKPDGAAKLAEMMPPRKGLATPADLAAEWKLNSESVRKALGNWRKKHAGGDGYVQNTERRQNEPQFTYDRAVVFHVLERLQELANRRELRRKKSSGKMPASQKI